MSTTLYKGPRPRQQCSGTFNLDSLLYHCSPCPRVVSRTYIHLFCTVGMTHAKSTHSEGSTCFYNTTRSETESKDDIGILKLPPFRSLCPILDISFSFSGLSLYRPLAHPNPLPKLPIKNNFSKYFMVDNRSVT